MIKNNPRGLVKIKPEIFQALLQILESSLRLRHLSLGGFTWEKRQQLFSLLTGGEE